MSVSTKKNISTQDFSKIIVEGVVDIFSKFLNKHVSESGKDKVKVSKLLDTLVDVQNEILKVVMDALPKGGKSKKTTEKKLKDPNAPKRPKSSYLFFCDEMRAQVKSDNPEFKAVDVTKELGRQWKELGEEEKKPFEKKAKKAKKNYESEMESYVRPSEEELQALADAKPKRSRKGSKEKKESKKKDPNAPKRPSSAFIYFCKDMRQEAKDRVLEENPAAKPSEVTKELGRMWKEDYADESDRKKWMKLAKKDKTRYESEMEEYKPEVEEEQAPKAKRGRSKAKKDPQQDEEEPKTPKNDKSSSKQMISIASLAANNPITEEELFGEDDE